MSNAGHDLWCKVESKVFGISQPFDLDLDSLPVERALRVLWNVEQDTLEVKVVPKQLAPTK